MPYAITLRLKRETALRVEMLARRIADQGRDVFSSQGYAPHITLAVLGAPPLLEALWKAVFGVTASWDSISLTLAGIGMFPGDPPVLWAAPVITEDLIACHRTLHEVLDPSLVDAHYLPEAWVPHVTLVQHVEWPLSCSMADLAVAWSGPIHGSADKVELVAFPPVRVLRSAALARGTALER